MNRRAFIASLAGLPLAARLVPQPVPTGVLPTKYLGEVFIPTHNAATGAEIYFAPPGTPFPSLEEAPDERWTLIGIGEQSARGPAVVNRRR